MVLKDEEALAYLGGAKITAALITAVVGLAKMFYGWGQALGSSIRRATNKTMC